MKDDMVGCLILVCILFLIGFLVKAIVSSNNDERLRDQQNRDFINKCLEQKDRKVEQVGSVWTKLYLVCNPK